jgi:hypothetical protein
MIQSKKLCQIEIPFTDILCVGFVQAAEVVHILHRFQGQVSQPIQDKLIIGFVYKFRFEQWSTDGPGSAVTSDILKRCLRFQPGVGRAPEGQGMLSILLINSLEAMESFSFGPQNSGIFVCSTFWLMPPSALGPLVGYEWEHSVHLHCS